MERKGPALRHIPKGIQGDKGWFFVAFLKEYRRRRTSPCLFLPKGIQETKNRPMPLSLSLLSLSCSISLELMSEADPVQTQQLGGARRACSKKEYILVGKHVIDNGSVAQGASGTEDKVRAVNRALHGCSAVFHCDPIADLSDILGIEIFYPRDRYVRKDKYFWFQKEIREINEKFKSGVFL